MPEPGAPPVGTACSNEDRFFVYLNARELVQTANEIRGSGATIASLGQNLEGLGLALRWTAAEELAAQGSMATEFSNGQLSNLAARLSALRFGARGFGVVNLYRPDPKRDRLLASANGEPEPGAVADAPAGETYGRWGGFLNGSFGYGSKEPTPLEDAFDFDGSELTLGVDYRLPSSVVLGGILGLSEQVVDFDEAASAISVVDGNIDAEGASLIVFALYQGERLNLSGSIGAQSLSYDIARNIKYPSFNPELESANSLANSHPETDVRVATFNFGYAFGSQKFTFEPFVNVEYLDATVDAFAEERSINLLSNDTVSKRFDLVDLGTELRQLGLDARPALPVRGDAALRRDRALPHARGPPRARGRRAHDHGGLRRDPGHPRHDDVRRANRRPGRGVLRREHGVLDRAARRAPARGRGADRGRAVGVPAVQGDPQSPALRRQRCNGRVSL